MSSNNFQVSGRKRRLEKDYAAMRDDVCPPMELSLILHDNLVEGYVVAAVIDVHSLSILAVQMVDSSEPFHESAVIAGIKRRAESLLATELEQIVTLLMQAKQAAHHTADEIDNSYLLTHASTWRNISSVLPLHELPAEEHLILPDYTWVDTVTPGAEHVLLRLADAFRETASYNKMYSTASSPFAVKQGLTEKLLELVTAWNATPYAALHLAECRHTSAAPVTMHNMMLVGDSPATVDEPLQDECPTWFVDELPSVEPTLPAPPKFSWDVVQAVLKSPCGMGVSLCVDSRWTASSTTIADGETGSCMEQTSPLSKSFAFDVDETGPGRREPALEVWQSQCTSSALPAPPLHFAPFDALAHSILVLNLVSRMLGRHAGTSVDVLRAITPRFSMHGQLLSDFSLQISTSPVPYSVSASPAAAFQQLKSPMAAPAFQHLVSSPAGFSNSFAQFVQQGGSFLGATS